MRSSRGITMLSLIATILIMIIITSITIFTTIQSYDQMKFETFKAELQEIQRKKEIAKKALAAIEKDKSEPEAKNPGNNQQTKQKNEVKQKN